MSGRPSIHVTNASSRKLHRGRVFNIMARPRHFERFKGNVEALTPEDVNLHEVRQGTIGLDEYRRRYDELVGWRFEKGALAPGKLCRFFQAGHPTVPPDSTLVCACSRATAARGECHRVWAARWLHEAGWRVVLDGQEYRP